MKFTFTDKKVNIPNRVHTYAEKKIGKLTATPDRARKPPSSSAEKGRNNLEVTIRPLPPSSVSRRAPLICLSPSTTAVALHRAPAA